MTVVNFNQHCTIAGRQREHVYRCAAVASSNLKTRSQLRPTHAMLSFTAALVTTHFHASVGMWQWRNERCSGLLPQQRRLSFALPKMKYEEFVNAFVGKRDVGRKLEDAVKAANAAWREEYKSDPEKLVSFLAKAHEDKAAAEAKKLDFGFVRLSPAAGEGSSASHGISVRERDQFEKRVQSSSSTLSSRGSPDDTGNSCIG